MRGAAARRWSRTAGAAVVLAASLAVTACATGTDAEPTTPASAEPSGSASSPVDSRSAGPVGAASSPGTADSTTPGEDGYEVLAGQFTAFIGAGDAGCDDSTWQESVEVLPWVGLTDRREQAVLGAVETVCLLGFDITRGIALEVSTPDGDVHTREVVLGEDGGGPVDLLAAAGPILGFGLDFGGWTQGSIGWWIAPDSPVGVYELVAVQDGAAATASVQVAAGSSAWLFPVPTDDPAVRRFSASGFPPGPAAFGVYRDTMQDGGEDGRVYELVTEVGVVTFDERGAGIVDVAVADLPSGEWLCVDSPVLAERCSGGFGYVDADVVPWE